MSTPGFILVKYAGTGRLVSVPLVRAGVPLTTIRDVKVAVRELEGILVDDQRLVAEGSDHALADDTSLSSLGYKTRFLLKQQLPADWAAYCKKTATFWGNRGHYQWEAQWNAAFAKGEYPQCTHDAVLPHGSHPVTGAPLSAAMPKRRFQRAAVGVTADDVVKTVLSRSGVNDLRQSSSQDTTRARISGFVVTSNLSDFSDRRSVYVRSEDGSFMRVAGGRDAAPVMAVKYED